MCCTEPLVPACWHALVHRSIHFFGSALPAELIRDVGRAGLLHDIGKSGVSNAILDKPGKPTEDEYVEIRRHAEHSNRILAQVTAFRSFARVAPITTNDWTCEDMVGG